MNSDTEEPPNKRAKVDIDEVDNSVAKETSVKGIFC